MLLLESGSGKLTVVRLTINATVTRPLTSEVNELLRLFQRTDVQFPELGDTGRNLGTIRKGHFPVEVRVNGLEKGAEVGGNVSLDIDHRATGETGDVSGLFQSECPRVNLSGFRGDFHNRCGLLRGLLCAAELFLHCRHNVSK